MAAACVSRWLLITLVYQLRLSWSSPPLSYGVHEELPVGTLIANLRQDADWLSRKYSIDDFERLRFALLQLGGYSGSMADLFVVNSTSGEILTGDVIDREAICSGQTTPCVVRIDVAVQPATYFEIIRAEVTVVDVNDNEPRFLQGISFRLTIPESSDIGATFRLPLATDPDIGENSAVEYRLNDPTDHFRLAVNTGYRRDGQVSELKLELQRTLDREVSDSYSLELLAVDRGHVPLTGTLDIEVIVGDENDNAPHFEQDEYRVDVPEDAPIGTTIARLHATDADTGENAHVRYSFSSRTAATYSDVFAIDPETGNVVLLQSLAYAPGDAEAQYHLSVVAEDAGPYPFPALSALVVHVIDVNSHSPRITVDAMNGDDVTSGTSQPEVEENKAPGTFVAHVTVSDADSGRNGVVSCELTDSDSEADFSLVEIYEGEYTLQTARQFDRETDDHVDVAITCRDGGVSPRSATRNVTVLVRDVNDNTPRFTQDIYEATLAENSPWGTVVTRVMALDPDHGDNGRITYLFDRRDSSSAGRRFHVDPDSGIVTTLAGLDREVGEVVEFGVVASDMANPARRRRMTRAVVRVHVADVDDQSPTFLRADYVFSVSENLAAGADVGQVSAVDLDSVPYNSFSYRLRQDDDDSAYFVIDSATGDIRTAVTLDRERRRMLRMSVIAQSDTVRARSDVAVVTVHVDDVNDHSPVFVFPNSVNNTVHLTSTAIWTSASRHGHRLIAVCQAVDADDALNARVSYDILNVTSSSSSGADLFRIGPTSGRLSMRVDSMSGWGENVTFAVLLRARDDGWPSLSTTALLYVVLADTAGVMDGHYWHKAGASSTHPTYRVLTALNDWMSSGGLLITASCLASLATFVVILSVAVCLVRARLGRRRRHKMLAATTTKIELQETPTDDQLQPVDDPLLAAEIGQLSDIALNELESEPVRYVYSCTSGHVTTLAGRETETRQLAADALDNDSGCGDDSASSYGSNNGTAAELSDNTPSHRPTTVANSAGEQDHHAMSSLTRPPQSGGTRSMDLRSGDLNALSVGSSGRKTVRFADDQPSPSDERERLPCSDTDRPTDLNYTIRPHYSTRVSLSTFHSNPTIADVSEL